MAPSSTQRYSIYPDCTAPGKPVSAKTIQTWLNDAPPWRAPGPKPATLAEAPGTEKGAKRCERGAKYVQTSTEERDAVNIALMLRRPLLITGAPGLGKSSLAYSIAYRLGLGTPLRWEINSRTTLQDGLYRYDAVGHLHNEQSKSIAEHISLGPLGTAMSPHVLPRVLLIDELDKSSYDLPNDLLHILEEARFRIPELRNEKAATIHTEDGEEPILAEKGKVETYQHPVVVITSNGDREFPKPFLRRCVQLELEQPNPKVMRRIVERHFDGRDTPENLDELLDELGSKRTDYILQAVHLSALGLDTDTIVKTLNA